MLHAHRSASPRALSALAILFIPASTALAGGDAPVPVGALWDEFVDGDLPELYQYSSPPSPTNTYHTFGPLGLGTHTIFGTNIQTSSGFGNTFEGDAIRFTVPAGLQLSEIHFDHDRAAGLREFLRISPAGTVLDTYVFRSFPAYYLPTGAQQLIGYSPIDPPARPPIIPGGGPLGPGDYLLSWDNQTFNTTMNYTLDLVIIPTPSSAAALLPILALAARRRRR